MKQQVINQIKNADIKVDDWQQDIIDGMGNVYAAGYLAATISKINSNGDSLNSEEFREQLLDACNYDIWK